VSVATHGDDLGGTAIDLLPLIALTAWGIGFGAAAGRRAARLDRVVLVWVVFGVILGPVSLLLLFRAPPGRCGVCRSSVRGWAWICAWCGSLITTRPTINYPGSPDRAPGLSGPVTAERSAAAGGTGLSIAAGSTSAISPLQPVSPGAEILRRTPRVAITPHPQAPRPISRRGRSGPARSGAEIRRPGTTPSLRSGSDTYLPPGPPEPPRILATGVFVAGSVGLQIGSRYLIAIDEDRLVVSGPADRDPTAAVFGRPVWEMDATGLDERLILHQREDLRGTSVMAFISLAGGTPESVAEAIKRGVQVEALSRE
jgi:hypothetical protein